MKKTIYIFSISAAFVLSLYGAFKLGEARATQKEREALAFSTLWIAKPAIQVIDFSETNESKIPRSIVLSANGAILMAGRMSFMFARDPLRLNPDSQNVLCAIAKNRHSYHKIDPDLFDTHLIEYLAGLENELATRGNQLPCKV